MELYLPPAQSKRKPRPTIIWTDEMIFKIKDQFPVRFNRELSKELGVGWRSLVRKARELGIEKEVGFLEKRRDLITIMAVCNNHNPHKGMKGWSVPGGESFRFKQGNTPLMKTNRDLIEQVRFRRNETIRSERIRIKLGLKQKTKLKLLV